MLHQVGDADGGRAAASVLAVDDAASSAVRLLLDGVGAAVEVAVQVLAGVVVDGDPQLLDGGGGERLLLGHVDAERHRLLPDELVAAGRAGVADEQGAGDLAQLQHPGEVTLTGFLTQATSTCSERDAILFPPQRPLQRLLRRPSRVCQTLCMGHLFCSISLYVNKYFEF